MVLSLIENAPMSGNFLDTNIIIYSVGKDSDKRQRSIKLISQQPTLSAQVLNETASALIRKFKMSVQDVQAITKLLAKECRIEPLTENTHFLALDIKDRYQFSFYDCLIIATALTAKCKILYSEDMQNGQIIHGQLQIINPFSTI